MNESTAGAFQWSEAVRGGAVPFNLDVILANLMGARCAHARSPFPIILAAPEEMGKGSGKDFQPTPMRDPKRGWTLERDDKLHEVGIMSVVKPMFTMPTDVDTLTIALTTSADEQKRMPTQASLEETRALRELASPRVYGTWEHVVPLRPAMYMYGPGIFEGAPVYNSIQDQPLPLHARGFAHPKSEWYARLQIVLAADRFTTDMVKVEPSDLPTGLPSTGYIRNAAEIRAISMLLRSLGRLIAWQWPITTLLMAEPWAQLAKEDAARRGYEEFIKRTDSLFGLARQIPLCPDSVGLLNAFQGATLSTIEGSGPLYAFPWREFGAYATAQAGRTFRTLDFLPWMRLLSTAQAADVTDGRDEINIFSIGDALRRMPDQEIQRMQRMAGALGWTGSATNLGKASLAFDRGSYVVTDGDHATDATAGVVLGTQYILPLTSRHRTVLPTHKLLNWEYAVLPVPMSEDPWEPWRSGFTNKVIPKWASLGEAGTEELDPDTIIEALALTGVPAKESGSPLSTAFMPLWPNDPGASDFATGPDPVPPADGWTQPGISQVVDQTLNPGDKPDLFLALDHRATPTEAVNLLGRGDKRGRLLYRRGNEVFATRALVRKCYKAMYLPLQEGGTWIGDTRPAFTRWEAGLDLLESAPTGNLGAALAAVVSHTSKSG